MPEAIERPTFQTIATEHRVIAHAGGGSELGNYPNAMECLDRWYSAGVRYFEFDLQWTHDGQLVGVHDWGPTFRRWFDRRALPWHWRMRLRMGAHRGPPRALFERLPMRGGLTPITPERLKPWLARHKDAWLVTDIKRDNPDALRELAAVLGSLRERVMAQVFSLDELELARELGFGQVAWANYVPKWPLDRLAEALPGQPLDAVVLDQRTLSGQPCYAPLDRLRQAGFELWVFSVNDPDRLDTLPRAVNGIITDCLLPG